jgi:chromosome segregation ATPase
MSRLTLSEQLQSAQATIGTLHIQVQNLQTELKSAENLKVRELDAAKAELIQVRADYEKKLKDKETSYAYQGSSLTAASNELEQAHAVLDGVEGAPARDYERTDGYGGKIHRNVVTRLAGAFLAIAKNGGPK